MEEYLYSPCQPRWSRRIVRSIWMQALTAGSSSPSTSNDWPYLCQGLWRRRREKAAFTSLVNGNGVAGLLDANLIFSRHLRNLRLRRLRLLGQSARHFLPNQKKSRPTKKENDCGGSTTTPFMRIRHRKCQTTRDLPVADWECRSGLGTAKLIYLHSPESHFQSRHKRG